MDDYRDMDEAMRKKALSGIKQMVRALHDEIMNAQTWPSRKMVKDRLGEIMKKCDESIGEQ